MKNAMWKQIADIVNVSGSSRDTRKQLSTHQGHRFMRGQVLPSTLYQYVCEPTIKRRKWFVWGQQL